MLTCPFRLSALLPLLLATGAALHADPVVFDQPYSVGAYYTWASSAGPGGPLATGYDDFTLTAAANVTAVQWHGNYIAGADRSSNPINPNTKAFTISFLTDSNGHPGTVLSTATIPMAGCAPQSLGTVGFSYDNTGTYQIPFYAYRAVLPTAFAAAAGQKYWISIVGDTNADGDNWSWYSNGDGTDGDSIQDYQGQQNRPFNRNFTLEGTTAAPVTVPSVSAAATVPKTTAGSGAPAVITLTLPAPAATKLNVKYTLGGTAVNGTDYQKLSGRAKFKAGQSSFDVQVVPQGDLGGASKKTVTLTLQAGNGYTVGTSKAVKVKITKSTVIILP